MKNSLLLYDSFNAKYLTFQDVAESFVSNEEFFQLAGQTSILLMGSRGCGKTTLLKMLTPAGLNYWKGNEANKIKEEIGYSSIYIPSDIQWKSQFQYISKYIGEKNPLTEIITQFLFASNCLVSLCKTLTSLIDFENYTDQERISLEYNICIGLAEVWGIEEKHAPTFDDIEIKLLQRVNQINMLVKKLIYTRSIDSAEKVLPDFVYMDFFDLIRLGCKVYEKELKLTEDHKWALCFDELEIVPKFIQLKLLKYLRSVDQKYLFKLTTTPLINLDNTVLEATQGNDFSTIKLWVYDEAGLNRWESFCTRLIKNRFEKNYGIDNIELETVFGIQNLDSIIKEELNELSTPAKAKLNYNGVFQKGISKGSSTYYLFKRLAEKDESFRQFLIKRQINPNEPFTNDKAVIKAVYLKYKVDATFRLIYKHRSRKTPPIHFGIPYIFDICDGNPRLVIGLVDELLQGHDIASKTSSTISKRDQSRIVYNASERYFNLLKNHPDATITAGNTEVNLATDLLDKIGAYMFNKLVKGPFLNAAPTTFRVDESLNHKYVTLLETALYLGAIIYLDPIEGLSNSGIVGKRFRLAGFLTPMYKIPSRISSEVKLSTLLRSQNDKEQIRLDY